MKQFRPLRLQAGRVEPLESRIALATFVVTTIADSGAGSLRQAILDANAAVNSGGPDIISFNIPGTGVKTINVSSALPAFTEAAILDGYTQPGSSVNTLTIGNDAVLNVVLAGVSNTLGSGLTISASGVTVRGLVIENFTEGIFVSGANAVIAGNWIGVSHTGTTAAGNLDDGIQVEANGVTIGGATPADRNVISASGQRGIELTGSFGSLTVLGNYIGTNATGTAALGNGEGGVRTGTFNINSPNVTISGNLISGNGEGGIHVQDSSGTVVVGNFIGTNAAGTAAIPNATGVIVNTMTNTRIGGTTAAERNVISGNTTGVLLFQGSGNSVLGNYIGTNAAGTAALPNVTGIDVSSGSNSNIIGGAGAPSRNVISGNSGVGILVNGSSGNRILGNHIGLDAAGAALGNAADGIILGSGASGNFIGGTVAGEGNVIADSGARGVLIYGSNNTVRGNFIGTDATGTAAIGNAFVGLTIAAPATGNLIGGSTAADRNVISGNDVAGISIESIFASDGFTTNNRVQGNFIGVAADGFTPLGNKAAFGNLGWGVVILRQATGNFIGGVGAGNVIAANDGPGAQIGAGASGNRVEGNFVGTNASGGAGLGNGGSGIVVDDSPNNIIGNTSVDQVVVANAQYGIEITGAGSTGNLVQSNFAGLVSATFPGGARALPNALAGIALLDGASGNDIGGTVRGNNASGNTGDGVLIENADNNVVRGNRIGHVQLITQFIPNGGAGVHVIGGTGNRIGSPALSEVNGILHNTGPGILVEGAGAIVTARGNVIEGNGGLGIDLAGNGVTANDAGDGDGGPNTLINFPTLASVARVVAGAGYDYSVTGSYSGAPNTTVTIDLYANPTADASGNGEGMFVIHSFSVTTDGTGVAPFTRDFTGSINVPFFGVPFGDFITAQATLGNGSSGPSSEFSPKRTALPGIPQVIAPKDPLTFTDANGDIVKVTLSGKGSLNVVLQGGAADNADIAFIELLGTDLTSKLNVVITSKPQFDQSFGTTIARISTADALQHMGEIELGRDIVLGDGVADALPDLRVSGKMNTLTLDDLAPNAFIKLGQDLPYDEPGNKVPDTRNNEPTLSVGDVLGAGVNIEVLGDGTPAGIGGGGFQSVTFNSWAFDGFLRTTQGIGKFLIKTGDFFGVLEVDKFRNGEQTTANVGSMIVAEGAWGSSGSEIEGNIGSFDVQAFAAGATITAGSMGRVKSAGELAGTFILTDPDAGGVPTFTVNSDFSARIISAVSIKKLKIKGDFTGSLEAPSIGSISAFSFLGTMGATEIVASAGKLGTLKSTTGVFRDYAIVTDEAFSGISVKARKLGADTVGIENVSITAASIGKITVDLAADSRSAGVSLTGIRDSEFITTATGTAKGTQGSIANVTVKLKGGAGGDGTGMENVTLDARVLAGEFGAGTPASTANPLGNLSVKVSGFGGASAGIVNGDFHGDTIGKTSVSVTRGGSGTARGVDGVIYTATGAIGAMKFGGDVTQNMIANLQVLAGGKLAGLNVAAKDSALGSIVDSAILAGQSLALTGGEKEQKAALSAASLGAVKIAGSLIGTRLVAGANIGGITVGGTATDSLILAGAMLGGDFTLGDGNETFQRAAAVSGVTVKGAFTRSSIVAGIASTNATFGDADDALAAVAGTLAQSSSIGAVKLGSGSGTNATGPAIAHDFAIQAAAIKSLANEGSSAVKDFAAALYLNAGTAGEDADDVLVRLRV